jgi:hypothetical protein
MVTGSYLVEMMYSSPAKGDPYFSSIRAAYLVELGERGQIILP